MTSTDRRQLLLALDSAATTPALAAANSSFNASCCNATRLLFNSTSNDTAASEHAAFAADTRYWALVMLLVPLFTIFGNVLVVLAVCRERSLQTVTNYFIVSLAFADILVATIVMPVSAYVEVRNGHWDFSDLACDLWIMCDALFSTASILNLVAISIDRFIAVTQPIKYSKHKNSKRTHFTIAATWLLSVAIALPIGCGLQNLNGLRHRQEFRHICTFYNGDFLIYSSLGSFYIPCLVMLVLYYRIFTVIRERAKKASASRKGQVYENQKATQMAGRKAKKHQHHQHQQHQHQHQQQQRQHQQAKRLAHSAVADRSVAQLTDTDCLACRTEGVYTGQPDLPHTCATQQRQGANCSIPLSDSRTLAGPSTSDNSAAASDEAPAASCCENDAKGAGRLRLRHFFRMKLKKKSSKRRDRSAARREKKATKTLAIVLGVFLLCWLPFFITNLMWAACLKNVDNEMFGGPLCDYDRRISVFIIWLGYMNSFMNPLIYTIFNTEFRKAFKKLLHIA